jgi:hypothetical protein
MARLGLVWGRGDLCEGGNPGKLEILRREADAAVRKDAGFGPRGQKTRKYLERGSHGEGSPRRRRWHRFVTFAARGRSLETTFRMRIT